MEDCKSELNVNNYLMHKQLQSRMQQTLEADFSAQLDSNQPTHPELSSTNSLFATNNMTNNENRPQSRSTDGTTDTSDGNQSDSGANAGLASAIGGVRTSSSDSSPSSHHQIGNLSMALQSVENSNPFQNFNQDLLYSSNPLIQSQMFSQIGRYQSFDQKPDVGALQQQMREAKPYKCTQCVKAFANSSYLSQHMRIHLGIKPFGPCNYCGKRFTQLSHLQQHIRTHTGEKPYKCKFTGCDKAFSQLSNLQSHSRCHQTDKPYKCNSCYKCFMDEQSLLEHIPKHKDSKHLKVHICSYCGKSYTQLTYLQKHMTKHSDRSKNGNNSTTFANEAQNDSFDQINWNMSSMADNSHDAASLNTINQFNGSVSMINVSTAAAVAGHSMPYQNSPFASSAFTQLLRNPRYHQDYLKTSADRNTSGFNMITPLESITRYNGNQGGVGSNSSTPSSNPLSQSSFNPQSIINNMNQ